MLNQVCKVLVPQLYLTLCDLMDCSPARLLCPWNSPNKNTGVGGHPPGSSVHGICQTRILEWVAISFSRGSS